jgi:hypothetical protein
MPFWGDEPEFGMGESKTLERTDLAFWGRGLYVWPSFETQSLTLFLYPVQRLLLMLLLGASLTACQRTPYAVFNKSTTPPIERVRKQDKAAPEVIALAHSARPVVVTPAVPAPPAAVSAPAKATERVVSWSVPVAAKTTEMGTGKAAVPTRKANLTTRLVQKRIAHLQQKEGARGQARSADTMALLSLIFGGTGLLFLLLGTGGILTILLGIAGFVLGLISLGSTSKKIMAVLGIIFGGVIVLLLAIVGFS